MLTSDAVVVVVVVVAVALLYLSVMAAADPARWIVLNGQDIHSVHL